MSRTLFATAAVAFVLFGATSTPARQERVRVTWENKVVDELDLMLLPSGPPTDDVKARFILEIRAREPDERRKLLTAGLNALGDQGWELAAIAAGGGRRDLYHFKRPK